MIFVLEDENDRPLIIEGNHRITALWIGLYSYRFLLHPQFHTDIFFHFFN
jgi:hypothetical protein